MNLSDTIVASATAPGRGAISVIRLSGTKSLSVAQTLSQKSLKPRLATYGHIFENETVLDSGLWIYFPAPHSFTGENVVEFQGHGGPVVVQAVLQAMTRLGARPAGPGEFSQRAFLNNKIDLTQAEAISDLINATSLSAVKAANLSLRGVFASAIHELVKDLINLRTQIEAHIDFPEEDIDPTSIDYFEGQIADLESKLKTSIQSAREGARLNQTTEIVLVGAPNTGKSSLLNALAREPLAIVTDIPGTTRDLIRHDLLIDGLEIRVTDTAGIRPTGDQIEEEGIRRTHNAIETADLVLCLFDERYNEITEKTVTDLIGNKPSTRIGVIKTKHDLRTSSPSNENKTEFPFIEISTVTGFGLEKFKSWLLLELNLNSNSETIFLARNRHVILLEKALNYVIQAKNHNIKIGTIDLIADDLRLTQNALSEITGAFTSDDLLGSIFSTFCIGK
jgi:tRNA modification GTPase